ncbi:hypothetical protein HispidOSU_031332 [Sigmodon hispidus]
MILQQVSRPLPVWPAGVPWAMRAGGGQLSEAGRGAWIQLQPSAIFLVENPLKSPSSLYSWGLSEGGIFTDFRESWAESLGGRAAGEMAMRQGSESTSALSEKALLVQTS